MICIVCGKSYPRYPDCRALTCSEPCHQKLVDRLVKEFGEFKRVVDVHTEKAYKAPTAHIIEHGLKYEDLPKFPEWTEESA